MRCSEPGHRITVAIHASRGPGYDRVTGLLSDYQCQQGGQPAGFGQRCGVADWQLCDALFRGPGPPIPETGRELTTGTGTGCGCKRRRENNPRQPTCRRPFLKSSTPDGTAGPPQTADCKMEILGRCGPIDHPARRTAPMTLQETKPRCRSGGSVRQRPG